MSTVQAKTGACEPCRAGCFVLMSHSFVPRSLSALGAFNVPAPAYTGVENCGAAYFRFVF